MSDVRRACLLAAVVWLGLHVTLGLMYVDAADSVALLLAAMVIFLVASAATLRPLVSPDFADPSWLAPALAASVPVIQLVSLQALEPGAVTTYANWAAGGTGVILAGLVFRGHAVMAVGAGGALIAVQTLAYAAEPGPGGFVAGAAIMLALPPQLWLLASWAVRRMVRNADRLTAELQTRAALSSDDAALGEAWGRLRAERLGELEAAVLPFLSAVAQGRTDGPTARARASVLAVEMRDALRARGLLDDSVRDAVAAARRRGVRVSLACEVDRGSLADATRAVLSELLEVPGIRSLVLRVSADPAEATCVLAGVDPHVATAAARAAQVRRLAVTDLDDTVVVSWTT